MKAATTVGIAAFFLLLFFVQGLFFIRANSQTYDEAMHLAAGYSYLANGDFRIEPQNPPLVKELLALPPWLIYGLPFNPDPQSWRAADGYSIGRDLLCKSILPADRILALSRLFNLALGGMLVALTSWWGYRLWGRRAAILAMTLASLEPNLVAHSSLVTTDIGVTLFMVLSVYLLWEYCTHRTWRLLIAVGIFTGMALATKFSAVLLLPIIALIILLTRLLDAHGFPLPCQHRQTQPDHPLLQSVGVILIMFFLAGLMIPLVYFSQGFQPWLLGLHQFFTLAREGQASFFLGAYSYGGWWSYFLLCFLIKTPIGILALIFGSMLFFRIGRPLQWRDAVFLLLPPVFVLTAMSQAKVNIGLRHILPVYPFLLLLASRLATARRYRGFPMPFVIGALVLFAAFSSLRIAPHQLAYFNEFVGGPAQGYRYLSDSNLDWGQDLKGLKTYMDEENLPIIYLSYFGTAPPSCYGIRYQYVPGMWPLEWPPPPDKVPPEMPRKILAVSVSNLQDVADPHNPLFRWLWKRKPLLSIGYSIFIYDLTDDREGLAHLQETYAKAGIRLRP